MQFDSFFDDTELQLGEKFLNDGFVIIPSESIAQLSFFKEDLTSEANKWLVANHQDQLITDLSESHLSIPQKQVNELRLHLFGHLNSRDSTRFNYFSLAADLVQNLVGNELAMQNKVNLSIQLPNDPTSVLELHSDVWSGDSPFQVVLWVPLTNSVSTNAMFLLKPSLSLEAYSRSRSGELKSMKDIHAQYSNAFEPIEVKFGEVLLFDSNCLHGNQLNTTKSTRWSLNCRFTSLLAPAISPERRLGPYYTPLVVRPATQMGLRAIQALGLLD